MKNIYYFDQFITETIRASEAYTAISALQTLVEAKRKIAFMVDDDLRQPEVRDLLLKLYEDGFKRMDVKGVNKSFIVYEPSHYREAEELKTIAEKYWGYLHYTATLDEHRRIGELLGYDKLDIDEFIEKTKASRGVKESFKSWPVVAGLAAGLLTGNPEEVKAQKPRIEHQYLSTWSDKIEAAKKAVIAKVSRNKNIVNKDVIIQKIKDVVIKEYKTKQTITFMYYYYDGKKAEDIVMVNVAKVDSTTVQQLLIHELNHLVDHHKIVVQDHKLIIKDLSRDEYASYFSAWRDIKKIKAGKVKKGFNIGKFFATSFFREKAYYLRETEVNARLSTLYQFLVDNGIIRFGDEIRKEHVDYLTKMVAEKFPDVNDEKIERQYAHFLANDFIAILPIINWEQLEQINRIVRLDRATSNMA